MCKGMNLHTIDWDTYAHTDIFIYALCVCVPNHADPSCFKADLVETALFLIQTDV